MKFLRDKCIYKIESKKDRNIMFTKRNRRVYYKYIIFIFYARNAIYDGCINTEKVRKSSKI